MFIMYSIIIGIVVFVMTYMIVGTICKAKAERSNREFANLPREVLLTHAQMNPVYMSQYASMLIGGVPSDLAAKNVTDRMLIDMGLIGYRKAES